MLNSLMEWLATLDWNAWTETAIENVYILYMLQFPLIAIGVYSLLKSVSVPHFWLRGVLAIITTVGFVFYHKTQVTPTPPGEIDFDLMATVAKEYIIGAGLGLLAFLITVIRSIVAGLVNIVSFIKKKKPLQA